MAAFTNAKQSIPRLFKAIMENHRELDSLREQAIVPFAEGKRLVIERRDFRRAAEKALRWNVDKGALA